MRIKAVELLTATFDSASQAVTLVWTPYRGSDPFLQYEVERREPDAIPIVMARLDAWADTTFIDTTVRPGIDYEYRVLVRNQAGLAVASNAMNGQIGLPIRLFNPVFDSLTATAVIGWTRFTGADFLSYEVLRKTIYITRTRAVIRNAADTTFTDSGLANGVLYTYQVALNRTNGIRFVVSGQAGGFKNKRN